MCVSVCFVCECVDVCVCACACVSPMVTFIQTQPVKNKGKMLVFVNF